MNQICTGTLWQTETIKQANQSLPADGLTPVEVLSPLTSSLRKCQTSFIFLGYRLEDLLGFMALAQAREEWSFSAQLPNIVPAYVFCFFLFIYCLSDVLINVDQRRGHVLFVSCPSACLYLVSPGQHSLCNET